MIEMARNERIPRIVIVGAGFGGAYCAQALERKLRPGEAEVVLLDRNNFFVFYPLLVEAGTGSLQPRHAVVSIRSFLKRARFLMAETVGVDVEAERIQYRLAGDEAESSLDYDHLVLALGSVTRMPPVPGLAEHAYEMKSLRDAVALRDRAVRLLERANAADSEEKRRALLHMVVVGANFTGAEVAGEFAAYLREASRSYPNISADECRVTIVELADRILGALDEDLSRFAQTELERRGVTVRLRSSVARIDAEKVVLDGGEEIAAHTTIWCAGIAAPPPLRGAALPVDERGYLLCEPDTRIRGRDNVWGIGDCAVNLDAHGNSFPATAQHAVREAKQLAGNLVATLRGEATKPMNYESAGTLAALGCRSGVARVFGVKLSGFWAWFLWRGVYLMKMPGAGRRLRVAMEWALDLLFRRDYVELGLSRPRGGEERK